MIIPTSQNDTIHKHTQRQKKIKKGAIRRNAIISKQPPNKEGSLRSLLGDLNMNAFVYGSSKFPAVSSKWKTQNNTLKLCNARHGSASVVMRDRSFWVLPHNKTALTTALEANFNQFLFTDAKLQQHCSSLAHFSSTLVDDKSQFPGGELVTLTSAEDVDKLIQEAGRHDLVIIDPKEWKQIPAENLIAAFQSSKTKLFAIVDSVEDATTMFQSLQLGVDGCVLRTSDLVQIGPFADLMSEMQRDSYGESIQSFLPATITRITPVGVGQRVCVDTCSILAENEGMMIGSSSQALYLVLSEAAAAEYAPSRPFRINAGPVHSYCLVPGGKTRYLSELRAGDPVFIVRNDGTPPRTAIVGRSKIETRPLLMIETAFETDDGMEFRQNIFLQNAETVRVATIQNDKPGMMSVCELKVGNHLLLRTDTHARHIGMPISEFLLEK